MASRPPSPPLLLLLLLLLPFSSAEDISCSNSSAPRSSKAVYSTYPNFRGACGYYDYGATVNGGRVTGVGRLYHGGMGCGACYHVACTDDRYCDAEGITVVVTDEGYADAGIDFVLSYEAFADLALPEFSNQLLDLGIVGVEYRRVSCKYPGHNLVIKVMEQSSKPGYLAIVFLYQGGQYNIIDVEVSSDTDDCAEWMPMRRAYGTFWDIENAPSGPLNVRFLASNDGQHVKWIKVDKGIPENWTSGAMYDTGIQLSSISSMFADGGLGDVPLSCQQR